MVTEGPRSQMGLFYAEREAAAKDCDTRELYAQHPPGSIKQTEVYLDSRDNVRQSFHSE